MVSTAIYSLRHNSYEAFRANYFRNNYYTPQSNHQVKINLYGVTMAALRVDITLAGF